MQLRALQWLRCPACQGALEAPPARPGAAALEAGALACAACARRYPVQAGVPQLLLPRATEPGARATGRTAQSFGFLWAQSVLPAPGARLARYHFEQMAEAVRAQAPRGLVLDAGCGEGIDLFNQAQLPGVEVVGVDVSEGGARTSYQRTRGLPNAHVVQGDLTQLPLAGAQFDYIYSYGVLHHLAQPAAGLQELVRVLKPGGQCLIYLYEDFSQRSFGARAALAAANSLRRITTRLPHRVLFRLCQLASPLVFLCFGVPYRVLRRWPAARRWAEVLPFRHAPGPGALAGDLYDRFSAPVEHRYSEGRARAFLETAGLEMVRTAYVRGWAVMGRKPLEKPACAASPAA